MSNTGKFRQNINSKITSNNKKEVSAARVRDVLVDAADAIDEIFETFSLADGLGTYDATSGIATIKETGATFTPVTAASQAKGKYFDVVVAGTRNITGTSVNMEVGGVLISRGTKWDYIPKRDGGLQKAFEIQTGVDIFKNSISESVLSEVPVVYGASGDLSAYVTTTNSNLRAVNKPIGVRGTLTKIELKASVAGTLKMRVFSNNNDGTYKLTRKFDLAVVSGVNVLLAGSAYTSFDVNPGDLIGYSANTSTAFIQHTATTLGASLSTGNNLDPDTGTNLTFVTSAAEFGCRFTVTPVTKTMIKPEAIPSLLTSGLNDDAGFNDWNEQSVLKNYLFDTSAGDGTEKIYGVTGSLTSHNTNANGNMRLINKPVTSPGFLKTFTIFCSRAGTLRVRLFRSVNAGIFRCFDSFDVIANAGLNTYNSVTNFPEIVMEAGDYFAFYNLSTNAGIGYSTGAAASSLALTTGADVSEGAQMSGLTESTAEFGINFTIDGTLVKQVIKSQFLPTDTDSAGKTDIAALNVFLKGRGDKLYTPKKYGILVAGQSNTVGSIPYSELPSWFTAAARLIPGVNFSNSTGAINTTFSTYTVAVNAMWGYDLFLYKLMLDYLKTKYSDPAYELFVIKHGVSGTSISVDAKPTSPGYWDVFFEKVPTSKPAITKSWEKRIRDILASSAAANFDIRCVVWHQGESDQGDPDNYYQNLKNLIWYIRGVLNNPKLRWVLGGINTNAVSYNATVQAAKIKLSDEDPYITFIPVSNALNHLGSDVLHWNAVGGEAFANSVFAAIKDLEPSSSMNGGFN